MPIYKDKPEYEGSKSLDDILCYLEKRDVKSFTRNGRTLTITLFSGLSYNVTLPEGGEDKPTIGSGNFKIQSNSDTAVNTDFTANTTDDTVGVKFVNGDNITVTAAASTSSTPATVTMGVASGYSIPSDAKQTEWDAKSDTDTKNTAGSMNTSDKIYIVGAKTKATTDNDNKQTYTNGNNYVGSDGWLYTGNNEKVLVDANLDFIRDALASMEEWPIVSTETTVSPQPTCYLTTNTVPNTIANYYRVTYSSTNVDVSNGGVYRAGSSLTTRNNISVNTTATFYPSTDVTYIAENRIYGMDYGYKNNLSDTTKYTEHEKTSTTQIATTCDRNDVSKTSNTKIELFKKVNSGDYSLAASANNSGATTSITISSGMNLGTLEEGTTKLLIKYTNPSTIARTESSGNVDEISAYYSSNINNFDSSHKKTITTQTVTIGEVETTYANSSTNGVKTGTELTIYGVYPLYTNGSRNQSDAITGDNRTNGTTGSASTYSEFVSLINYAANATSTWYISFGEIDTNNTNVNKAYIYTPAVTGGRTVTITDVQGANSSTGLYDSGTVSMTIVDDTIVNITVDGVSRSYKRWWIKNPGGSEGANSYKVTITAANE